MWAAGDEQQKRDFLRVLPTWNGIIAVEALREIEAKVAMITGNPVPTAVVKPPTVVPTALPTTVTSIHSPRFSPSTIKLLSDLQAVFENPPGPRISGIVTEIFKRLDRSGEVSREVLADLDYKAKQVDKKSLIETIKQMIKDNKTSRNVGTTNTIPQTTPVPSASDTISTSAPLNFELPPNFQIDLSLLSSIVELNKLNSSTSTVVSPSKPEPARIESSDKHFVDIPLNSADLLVSRPNLFQVLYDDLSLHCKTCGIRFRDTESGRKRLTIHLDSHFRRNMRLKEKSKRVLARDLFGSEEDWISAKEDSENLSERTVNIFEDSSTQDQQSTNSSAFNSFVEATEEEQSSQIKCSTCQEIISVIWNDEREQWIFPACIRNEFNEIVHVTCSCLQDQGGDDDKVDENISKKAKII